MANGLRRKMYDELREEFRDHKLIKFSEPKSGETIKFKGTVLYKAFRISNPWRNDGIVVFRGLTESALEIIGGKISKGKKKWSGAPLTDKNYEDVFKMLKSVVNRGAIFGKIMSPIIPPIKRITKPKKKKY